MLVFFAFFALHGLMIYLLPEGALLYWVLMPLLVPLALACLIVIIQAALHPRQPLRGFLVLRLMGHVIEAAVLAVMVSGAFTGMDSPARRMVRAARHRGPDVYVETSRLMLSKTQGQLTDLARAWYVVAADPLAPFWLARWAQEYTREFAPAPPPPPPFPYILTLYLRWSLASPSG